VKQHRDIAAASNWSGVVEQIAERRPLHFQLAGSTHERTLAGEGQILYFNIPPRTRVGCVSGNVEIQDLTLPAASAGSLRGE
jgi:hypothetical protein